MKLNGNKIIWNWLHIYSLWFIVTYHRQVMYNQKELWIDSINFVDVLFKSIIKKLNWKMKIEIEKWRILPYNYLEKLGIVNRLCNIFNKKGQCNTRWDRSYWPKCNAINYKEISDAKTTTFLVYIFCIRITKTYDTLYQNNLNEMHFLTK